MDWTTYSILLQGETEFNAHTRELVGKIAVDVRQVDGLDVLARATLLARLLDSCSACPASSHSSIEDLLGARCQQRVAGRIRLHSEQATAVGAHEGEMRVRAIHQSVLETE